MERGIPSKHKLRPYPEHIPDRALSLDELVEVVRDELGVIEPTVVSIRQILRVLNLRRYMPKIPSIFARLTGFPLPPSAIYAFNLPNGDFQPSPIKTVGATGMVEMSYQTKSYYKHTSVSSQHRAMTFA